jgi:hypothetical protein
LDGLPAGQAAEGGNVLLGVEEVPEALRAVAGEGVLPAEGAPETDHVLRRVGARDPRPAGVARPPLLQLLSLCSDPFLEIHLTHPSTAAGK